MAGCTKKPVPEGPMAGAIYLEDTELGEGAKTFTLEVIVEENTVRFTVHTDRDILGDALLDNGLIDGEEGPYGLYIKVVNGITADYDIDQSYWGFNINGEGAMTGVDGCTVTDGDTYQLVYSK